MFLDKDVRLLGRKTSDFITAFIFWVRDYMIYFLGFKIFSSFLGENFANLSVRSLSGLWCSKISRTINAFLSVERKLLYGICTSKLYMRTPSANTILSLKTRHKCLLLWSKFLHHYLLEVGNSEKWISKKKQVRISHKYDELPPGHVASWI